MKQWINPVHLPLAFRRLKWRLILSYYLVTLAAIFILAWWGLVVGTVYLQQANPTLTWQEVIQEQVLPALRVILPSAVILIIPATLISAYFGFLTARWLDIRLADLLAAVRAWKRGNFTVMVDDRTADEIGSFGQELNGMARDMEHLLQIRAGLAALDERNHLARDLHDSVKQQITAASFQISAAQALLQQDPRAARACLTEAENLVHKAHQELNSIIFELRPVELTTGGLAASLRKYLDGWGRQNRMEVHAQVESDWTPDRITHQEIMRFLQEALSNVARHSRARRVHLRLACTDQEAVITLEDNGCGFEQETTAEKGFGLTTMRERIESIGGRLSVESRPGQGTVVTAHVPMIHPKAIYGNEA